MPWGYKTLGEVAWTPTLGVEALRKKVVWLRSSKKREGKEQGWERENWWLLISWVQSQVFVFTLILVSWIPRIISMSLPFPWSQLEWAPLNFDSDLVLDPSLPDTNRDTHLFQHHYEWNTSFFAENRVYRPPNTIHHHTGQECPKCEWMYVRSGLTECWITTRGYTACARPILSFPRS